MTGKSGEWYRGTANAIYQNTPFIEQYDVKEVVVGHPVRLRLLLAEDPEDVAEEDRVVRHAVDCVGRD